MTSITQRTLKYLRAAGYVCGIVEHWNSFCRVRQDLFGFIDIIAIDTKGKRIIAVQTTSGSHHSDRVTKIKMEERAIDWTEGGGSIMMISWTKAGEKGKRKAWTPRMEMIHESLNSNAKGG